jgi:hypothetical protein
MSHHSSVYIWVGSFLQLPTGGFLLFCSACMLLPTSLHATGNDYRRCPACHFTFLLLLHACFLLGYAGGGYGTLCACATTCCLLYLNSAFLELCLTAPGLYTLG